jgi:hypothetical protein
LFTTADWVPMQFAKATTTYIFKVHHWAPSGANATCQRYHNLYIKITALVPLVVPMQLAKATTT